MKIIKILFAVLAALWALALVPKLLAGLMKLQEKISGERSFRKQKPELFEKLKDALS